MNAIAPPSLACPACGAALLAGDRFCEACGAGLPEAAVPPAEEKDFAEEADDDTTTTEGTIGGEPGPSGPLSGVPGPSGPLSGVPGPACVSCGATATEVADGYCGVCGMKQPAARDHLETDLDGIAAVTDRGRRHHRNEDAFAVHVDDRRRVVAVVSDGVSSTVNPDLASQAAADAALGLLLAGLTDEADTVPALLLQAHRAAQAAVEAVEGRPQPDLGWPSCTLLAAVVAGGTVDLAGAGDCRAVWLPAQGDEGAEVLTEDDSWAAEKVAVGALTPEEAYDDTRAHTITRWLGRDADAGWQPRLVRFEAPSPGRLVLCSDGLWNYAEAASEVARAAAGDGEGESGALLDVARRLVDHANQRGGHDNITVVVVNIDLSPPAVALSPPAVTQSPAAEASNVTDDPDPVPSKGPIP